MSHCDFAVSFCTFKLYLLYWCLSSLLYEFAPKQDAASKTAEAEWREKAKKELEDWHVHQSEQMEKNKSNNRLVSDMSLVSMQRSNRVLMMESLH